MSYNAKNYTEQGGEKTVIGGELEVQEGGVLKFQDGSMMCTSSDVKGVLSIDEDGYVVPMQLDNQAASTATTVATLKDDLNALLTKLKEAGFMVADEPEPEEDPEPTPEDQNG